MKFGLRKSPLLASKAVVLWSLIAASSALALPSAENYQEILQLGEGTSNASVADAPIVLKDTDDPKIVYVPYDQVYLRPKGGDDDRERFGLVYDEQGGMLNATLRAGYSASRLKYIQALRDKGLKPTALPIVSGGWAFSIHDAKSEYVLGAYDKLDTVLPDVDVATSIFFKPDAIRYIVSSYNTGAGLGVNYMYTYRAVLTPMRMKASIQWQSIQQFIQNETKISTKSEVSTSAWFGLVNGKASLATVSEVRKIARTAIERQWVKINIVGGGGSDSQQDRDARIIDEVTKVILAKVFKPMETNWKPRELNVPDAKCEAGNPLFGVSFCFSASVGYLYSSETTFEDRYYDYNIVSQDVVNLTGIVGSNFSYMCKDHPDLFHNVRTGADGCPTKWDYDGKGIVTETQPGAPKAVMPAKSADGANAPAVSLDPPHNN